MDDKTRELIRRIEQNVQQIEDKEVRRFFTEALEECDRLFSGDRVVELDRQTLESIESVLEDTVSRKRNDPLARQALDAVRRTLGKQSP
jgi:hypothetical protein